MKWGLDIVTSDRRAPPGDITNLAQGRVLQERENHHQLWG